MDRGPPHDDVIHPIRADVGQGVSKANRLTELSRCPRNCRHLAVVLQPAPDDDPELAHPRSPVGTRRVGALVLRQSGQVVECLQCPLEFSPCRSQTAIAHAAWMRRSNLDPGRAPGAPEGTTAGRHPSRASTSSSKATTSKYVRSLPTSATSSPGSLPNRRLESPCSSASRHRRSAARSSSSGSGRRITRLILRQRMRTLGRMSFTTASARG